jgi:cytochrome P450 family 144
MLTASMLLGPGVLHDQDHFYATLREQAPVWAVPGTDVVAISAFELLSEAVARPEDFSSTMHCLLYRDGDGLPARREPGAYPRCAPYRTAGRRALSRRCHNYARTC